GPKPRAQTGHVPTSDGTRDPHSGHENVTADIGAKRTPQTHSVDCSETNRPQVGHWYSRTESSFSRGRPRTEVVPSLTWWRSSTISRSVRFRGPDDGFGVDVARGRDLRSLPYTPPVLPANAEPQCSHRSSSNGVSLRHFQQRIRGIVPRFEMTLSKSRGEFGSWRARCCNIVGPRPVGRRPIAVFSHHLFAKTCRR